MLDIERLNRELNLKYPVFGYSPKGIINSDLTIRLAEMGCVGLIDVEGLNRVDFDTIYTQCRQEISSDKHWGIRISCKEHIEWLSDNKNIPIVIVPFKIDNNEYTALKRASNYIISEVCYLEDAEERKNHADFFLVKGIESGGHIGEKTSFILIQEFNKAGYPFIIQGGFGVYNIAGAIIGGALSVVLDSQLFLLPECPLDKDIKDYLLRLDENDTYICGEVLRYKYRTADKINNKAVRRLKEVERERLSPDNEPRFQQYLNEIISECKFFNELNLRDALLPIGQDIVFAKFIYSKYKNLQGYLEGISELITQQPATALKLWPFVNNANVTDKNELARIFKLNYPIVQGPMINISNNVAFAMKVAQDQALPVLTLDTLKENEAEKLISNAKETLKPHYSFACGLTGIQTYTDPTLQKEIKEKYIELIQKYRPQAVHISANSIDLAKTIENLQIPTIFRTPNLRIFKEAIFHNISCIVLEGLESGDLAGSLSSLMLWERILQYLDTIRDRLQYKIRILFAGGIADSAGAAILATILGNHLDVISPGIQMETAYLFTEEITATSAIDPLYQELLLENTETKLIGTTINSKSRVIPNSFSLSLIQKEIDRVKNGISLLRRKILFEDDNIVSLEQTSNKCLRAGQIISVNQRKSTISELHTDIIQNAKIFLKSKIEKCQNNQEKQKILTDGKTAIVGISSIISENTKKDIIESIKEALVDAGLPTDGKNQLPVAVITSNLNGVGKNKKIAETFNFTAKSINVDVTNDSNLGAIDTAVKGLLKGDFDIAITGNSDFIVLKRLCDAIQNGDKIYAALSSSGYLDNNIGYINAETSDQNGSGLQSVIKTALKFYNRSLSPSTKKHVILSISIDEANYQLIMEEYAPEIADYEESLSPKYDETETKTIYIDNIFPFNGLEHDQELIELVQKPDFQDYLRAHKEILKTFLKHGYELYISKISEPVKSIHDKPDLPNLPDLPDLSALIEPVIETPDKISEEVEIEQEIIEQEIIEQEITDGTDNDEIIENTDLSDDNYKEPVPIFAKHVIPVLAPLNINKAQKYSLSSKNALIAGFDSYPTILISELIDKNTNYCYFDLINDSVNSLKTRKFDIIILVLPEPFSSASADDINYFEKLFNLFQNLDLSPDSRILAVSSELLFGTEQDSYPISGAITAFIKSLKFEYEMKVKHIYTLDITQILTELEYWDDQTEVAYYGTQRHTLDTSDVIKFNNIDNKAYLGENDLILFTGSITGLTFECLKILCEDLKLKIAIIGKIRVPENQEELQFLSDIELQEKKQEIIADLEGKGQKATPIKVEQEFDKLLNQIETLKNIRILNEFGSEIKYYCSDITNKILMNSLIKQIRKDFAIPVSVIMHAEGERESRKFVNKKFNKSKAIVSTKIEGIWNVLNAVELGSLRRVICFSSFAGRFGNFGQTDFGFANGYLSRLCWLLSQNGIPSLAIDWAACKETGITSKTSIFDILTRNKENLIPLKDAAQIFKSLLQEQVINEVVVAGILPNQEEAEESSAVDIIDLADQIIERDDKLLIPDKLSMIDSINKENNYYLAKKMLSVNEDTYIQDYKLQNSLFFPAVMILETYAQMYKLATGDDLKELHYIEFKSPLKILNNELNEEKELKIIYNPLDGLMQLSSFFTSKALKEKKILKEHSTATIGTGYNGITPDINTNLALSKTAILSKEQIYKILFQGRTFQVLDRIIDISGKQIYSRINISDQPLFNKFLNKVLINPLAIEAALQTASLYSIMMHNSRTVILPLKIKRLNILPGFDKEKPEYVIAEFMRFESPNSHYNIKIIDKTGKSLFILEEAEFAHTDIPIGIPDDQYIPLLSAMGIS